MAKKAAKATAKAADRPATRALQSSITVTEAERTPLTLRHSLGTCLDRDGAECRVTAAFPAGQAVFLERDGRPTRYVTLADLIGAMLDAEG